MKKFLITVIIIITIGIMYDVFFYRLGFFIDFNPKSEVTTFVKTSNKDMYLKKDKFYEKFEIKGVDLGSGIPGHYATDYAIDKKTYKRWFKLIQEMGANTIRVYTILNSDFYDAFYEYNKENENPLYLIHGLWVNDYVQNSRKDAYDRSFKDKFLSDSKTLIDVVHGRKRVSLNNDFGTGFYNKDISPWVIGYILGIEWEDITVVYTDIMNKEKVEYSGKYLYSTPDASPFEVMLTEVGDKILEYESRKYKTQKMLAFSNWPTTDPFTYPESRLYDAKVAVVDVEHIKMTKKVISGTFASYHIYPYYPDYLNHLDYTLTDDGLNILGVKDDDTSTEVKKEDKSEKNEEVNTYKDYLTAINNHHSIPVVVSEFGVPSSRGMAQIDKNTKRNQGALSEKDQGQALVKSYEDIKNSGISGAIVFSWQDEWFKRTWNTMQNVDLTKTPYWSDYQTNEQYFGLLSFDPGKVESVSYVDGDVREWKKSDIVSANKDMTISMKYDEKFVYFMVNKTNYNGEKIYIPIDTTPKSGANSVNGTDLSFNRDADFLITIDGEDNSSIRVQERYDAAQAMFGFEINNTNSYVNPPEKTSNIFNPILLTLNNYMKIENGKKYTILAETYETGKLTFGNANPSSSDFNSLADFYINKDNIEIKIPWQLLNFADPSNMKIHDDYYKNYGVEHISINKMYVGVGTSGDIKLDKFRLKPWGHNITYHERLKSSYYILKDLWTGGE